LGADVLDEGAGLLVCDAAGAEGADVAGVAADPAAVCVAWLQPLRAMAAAARAAKSSEPSVRARPRQDRPVTGDMGTFPMLTTRHALEIRETGDGRGAKRCKSALSANDLSWIPQMCIDGCVSLTHQCG